MMNTTEKHSIDAHRSGYSRTMLIVSLVAFAASCVLLLTTAIISGNTTIGASTEASGNFSSQQLLDTKLQNAEEDVADFSRHRNTLLNDIESTKSEIELRMRESDDLCHELERRLSSLEIATHFTAEESARIQKRNYYLKSTALPNDASDSEIFNAFVRRVTSTNVGGDVAELKRNLEKTVSLSRASLDRQSYALREIPEVQAKLESQLQDRDRVVESLRPLHQRVADLMEQVVECDAKIGEARSRVAAVRTAMESHLARQVEQQRERDEAELSKSTRARAAFDTVSQNERQQYIPTYSSTVPTSRTSTKTVGTVFSDRRFDPTYRPPVGQTWVNSYTKSNGTTVRGHYRTKSDDSFYNNYNSKGNINPNTGRKGTRTP